MNEKDRHDVWAMPTWIQRAVITSNPYYGVLCEERVTHVFLGEKRGTVGQSNSSLLPEELLREDPAMTLLHEEDRAQIWQFDRAVCGAPRADGDTPAQ